jgi:GNAT superfamily N-acetyltransferase
MIEVRAATVADRAAVIRMLAAQMEEHAIPVEEDGTARAVELALAPSSVAWLLIATVGGIPAGVLLANPLVSIEHGGASLWIEELYVMPAHRRRGVARALVAHVTEAARQSGLRGIDLEVAGERIAHAFWQSLGYRDLGRTRYQRNF